MAYKEYREQVGVPTNVGLPDLQGVSADTRGISVGLNQIGNALEAKQRSDHEKMLAENAAYSGDKFNELFDDQQRRYENAAPGAAGFTDQDRASFQIKKDEELSALPPGPQRDLREKALNEIGNRLEYRAIGLEADARVKHNEALADRTISKGEEFASKHPEDADAYLAETLPYIQASQIGPVLREQRAQKLVDGVHYSASLGYLNATLPDGTPKPGAASNWLRQTSGVPDSPAARSLSALPVEKQLQLQSHAMTLVAREQAQVQFVIKYADTQINAGSSQVADNLPQFIEQWRSVGVPEDKIQSLAATSQQSNRILTTGRAADIEKYAADNLASAQRYGDADDIAGAKKLDETYRATAKQQRDNILDYSEQRSGIDVPDFSLEALAYAQPGTDVYEQQQSALVTRGGIILGQQSALGSEVKAHPLRDSEVSEFNDMLARIKPEEKQSLMASLGKNIHNESLLHGIVEQLAGKNPQFGIEFALATRDNGDGTMRKTGILIDRGRIARESGATAIPSPGKFSEQWRGSVGNAMAGKEKLEGQMLEATMSAYAAMVGDNKDLDPKTVDPTTFNKAMSAVVGTIVHRPNNNDVWVGPGISEDAFTEAAFNATNAQLLDRGGYGTRPLTKSEFDKYQLVPTDHQDEYQVKVIDGTYKLGGDGRPLTIDIRPQLERIAQDGITAAEPTANPKALNLWGAMEPYKQEKPGIEVIPRPDATAEDLAHAQKQSEAYTLSPDTGMIDALLQPPRVVATAQNRPAPAEKTDQNPKAEHTPQVQLAPQFLVSSPNDLRAVRLGTQAPALNPDFAPRRNGKLTPALIQGADLARMTIPERRQLPRADNRIQTYIDGVEKARGLPPNLLKMAINGGERSESTGKLSKSSAGAEGIAQFIPATADEYGLNDRTDPLSSIEAAADFMAKVLKYPEVQGDPLAALAYYNGGGKQAERVSQGQLPNNKQTFQYLLMAKDWLSAFNKSPANAAHWAPSQQKKDAYDAAWHGYSGKSE